jgi:hypothetical protein
MSRVLPPPVKTAAGRYQKHIWKKDGTVGRVFMSKAHYNSEASKTKRAHVSSGLVKTTKYKPPHYLTSVRGEYPYYHKSGARVSSPGGGRHWVMGRHGGKSYRWKRVNWERKTRVPKTGRRRGVVQPRALSKRQQTLLTYHLSASPHSPGGRHYTRSAGGAWKLTREAGKRAPRRAGPTGPFRIPFPKKLDSSPGFWGSGAAWEYKGKPYALRHYGGKSLRWKSVGKDLQW